MAQVPTTDRTPGLLLGLVIDGLGSHPAAWRTIPEQSAAAHRAGYYVELVRRAEAAGFDLAILADRHRPPAADGAYRGRLDAALLAARLAPATHRIGLVPEFTVTHAEPFHVSKSIATIDHAGHGRAGWVIGVSTDPTVAAQYGRREAPDSAAAWREAAEVADVVQRLWDSWEDDAEIRDIATGRFVDTAKLHYVDFAGEFFSVKGPSITPRPPQGRPPTFVRTGDGNAEAVIGPLADVVVSRFGHPDDHVALDQDVRDLVAESGRPDDSVVVLAELDVTLAESDAAATEINSELTAHLGMSIGDDHSFVGSAERLVELIASIAPTVDGVVINFSVLPTQLSIFVDRVVPALRERGLLRAPDQGLDLRSVLGLPRPVNRYAADPDTSPPEPAKGHCDRCAEPAGSR